MKNLLVILLFINFVFTAQASTFVNPKNTNTKVLLNTSNDTTPLVFMLGQDDRALEALKLEHDLQLLAVCRNDMEMTYYLWIQMMKHMESYANRTGFDLNGIKLWIYAFYNKDGSVRHLAYHAKPQSRNFKPEDMNVFLTSFVKTYKLPISADRPFQHYNVGFFPVLVEKMKDSRSGNNNHSNGGGNNSSHQNMAKTPRE
ncbi:MAG: hypothetical protein U5L45_23210 [Saprospiraceae bacterium]|nr:hypothetical protein [Saprospiraceae bacterium]